MDTEIKGYLTRQDFSSAMVSISRRRPPPGGGPRAQGSADDNLDGTVSLQEQQANEAAQAEADSTSTPPTSLTTVAALQTYRSVQSA